MVRFIDLRRLTLELTFWDRIDPEENGSEFISKVTQFVAPGRMQYVDIHISGPVEL